MNDGAAAVNPWMMLPFGVLLGLIAFGPLLFPIFWQRHYAKAACGLAAFTLAYYFISLHDTVRVARMTHDYVSFIVLTGSLFVVAGGIHINVKGEATPTVNVIFLLIGALLANILGTTGASMLLIQPWLRMNKYRVTTHHVVFFIFIISNAGGCITPIGPPLFLGYLVGVPFWWEAEHCLPAWAMGLAMLLAVFFVVDQRNYLRAPKSVRAELAEPRDEWRFEGAGNLVFLAIILASVFINNPPFLREALMIGAAVASYFTTCQSVHEANHFNFHPIREVAVLFIGIFATMLPALDWLEANAKTFGTVSTTFLYWGSGLLSSTLDNAPTYLCFLKAISVQFAHPGQDAIASLLGNPDGNRALAAISIGSVFFGANTYIGNGPNFMVKAIADHQKIHTPGFLGYIWQFSLPFMLPVLLVMWFLFFRG